MSDDAMTTAGSNGGSAVAEPHVGRSLRRKEDPRLITGLRPLGRRHLDAGDAVSGVSALPGGARADGAFTRTRTVSS
jgi:hypothetical protein